ncbi:high affinity glucose transporter [Cerrena zonata]|uniref:High affinity glucose transporter n=1 Tax=Cerrena zonata TaxID=2478898 RepID=A0AAW0FMD0_9APHY
MSLGSFFGSLATSFVSEPFGRRASLILCGFFWCVGAAIQSSSQNIAQLIIGRLISGFGVGLGSSVAPVYGSELAPRKIRGLVGGMFQLSVTIGILIMFYVSYGCGKINGVGGFRLAWGIQIIPGLILLMGCLFIPESPRWLAKNGYWDQCEEIVARIQAKGNREDPDVMIEISEIKDQLLLDEHVKSFTYADLFSEKYLQRTITAIFAQIWQQLTDKLGRRPVLLFGAAAMMAFQFGVAGILATYSVPWPDSGSDSVTIRIPSDNKSAAKGVIACCYLFVCSFATSWGVGIWLYCSEMWGDSVSRQRGAALATSANWIFNFAIAQFTPPAFKNISWKTYCIYATFCGCMFIHVYFFFPETRGKRLEEIAQIWEEKVPAWKSDSWQPAVPILSDAELGEKIRTQHKESEDLIQSNSDSSVKDVNENANKV